MPDHKHAENLERGHDHGSLGVQHDSDGRPGQHQLYGCSKLLGQPRTGYSVGKFHYLQPDGANISSQASPGTIAIQNAAIEDNAMPGTIEDIKSSFGGGGKFNQFIVEDDDEAATIRGLDADGSQGLTCTANHCGSYVYSANLGAPVIWLDKANISPQCGGNGVTVYNNNTVRVTDSVMQGFGMWAVNTQTTLGNYGGTELDNIYMEEGAGPLPESV
jgi:hypothetical protein